MNRPPFQPDSETLECYSQVLKDLRMRCEVSPKEEQRDFYGKTYDLVKQSMELTTKTFK